MIAGVIFSMQVKAIRCVRWIIGIVHAGMAQNEGIRFFPFVGPTDRESDGTCHKTCPSALAEAAGPFTHEHGVATAIKEIRQPDMGIAKKTALTTARIISHFTAAKHAYIIGWPYQHTIAISCE